MARSEPLRIPPKVTILPSCQFPTPSIYSPRGSASCCLHSVGRPRRWLMTGGDNSHGTIATVSLVILKRNQ